MNSLNKTVYQKAKELYESGYYEKAELILKRLFQDHGHDVYVNHLMAVVMIRLKRKTDMIVGHLKNVLYLGGPKSLKVQGYLLLGYLYLQRKNLHLAEKVLRELESMPCSHVQLYALLGYVSYQKKDFVGAEGYYEKALSLSPENANSLNGLGCTYLEMRTHLDKARQCIKKALKQDEGNYAYLESMGWYYMVRQNVKEAFDFMQRSIKIRWHAVTEKKLKVLRRLLFR